MLPLTDETRIRLVAVVDHTLVHVMADVLAEVMRPDRSLIVRRIDVQSAQVLVDLVDRFEADHQYRQYSNAHLIIALPRL